jgi:hypothetical protein
VRNFSATLSSGAALAAAALVLTLAPTPAARATTRQPVPAQWTLMNISPSGRLLQIGALDGGCQSAPVGVTKTEDAASVALTVTLQALVFDPGEPVPPCAPAIEPYRADVRLDRPLAGRRLTTLVRLPRVALATTNAPTRTGPRAPRLTGANAADALRALANLGLKAHLLGPPSSTVLRQRPAAGQPLDPAHGLTLVTQR